jgi:hypothetical protein
VVVEDEVSDAVVLILMLVVVVLVVVTVVVFVLVVVVVTGHCGQDAQNHWLHASFQPPLKLLHKSAKHSAVVVVLFEVVVLPVKFVDVVVTLTLVVLVVYGHSGQPLQYQLPHASCQPPCMVLQSTG